jgi:hypothetical protein
VIATRGRRARCGRLAALLLWLLPAAGQGLPATVETHLVPVGTLPTTLTRTCDSRDKLVGDFGVGWTLGISNVRVEKTHALGKYWSQNSTGGWFPLRLVTRR